MQLRLNAWLSFCLLTWGGNLSSGNTAMTECRRCTKMTALLVRTEHFYWNSQTRLLVVLRGLQIKKDTRLWVSLI
jgi:hypothetical protein